MKDKMTSEGICTRVLLLPGRLLLLLLLSAALGSPRFVFGGTVTISIFVIFL